MFEPDILREILAGYRLPLRGMHGLPHWGRVLENGLRLAEKTGADPEVVRLFALFHDSRRQNEIIDPGHGARGAALAAELGPRLAVSGARLELLQHACAHHTDRLHDDDPTVQTCWDADRLDLWRCDMTPCRPGLGTDAANEAGILEWSRERSVRNHVPDFVEEWLAEAEGPPGP